MGFLLEATIGFDNLLRLRLECWWLGDPISYEIRYPPCHFSLKTVRRTVFRTQGFKSDFTKQTKNKNQTDWPGFCFWRWQSDLNRWIRVLQTHALPLGYVAILNFLKKIGHKKLGEFCVLFFMERMTRLELATSTLARWRSTRWATSAYNWCLRSESNQWHEDFQSSALPTELQRQKMATRNGLEPSTSSVTG